MPDVEFLARYPQYVQLLGVGIVWISLHCAGMCGPIVIGLDLGANFGTPDPAKSRFRRLAISAAHITFYQLGRSVTYAVIGALAGWGGAALQVLFRQITKATGFVVAIALLFFGLARLLGSHRLEALFGSGNIAGGLAKLAKWARKFSGIRQKFLLGIILGFLPCMITFWALGLAASTQSPLHGAIIMVMLVWMTSVVIFGFGLAPGLAPKKMQNFRERLLSIFLIFSGLWLGLVSAAANEWIAHKSITFSLGGKGFAIMFW